MDDELQPEEIKDKKSHSTLLFVLCLCFYIIPPLIAKQIEPILKSIDGWWWLLAMPLAMILSALGFMAQIYPPVYITDKFKSWGMREDKADCFVWSVWFGLFVVYWIGVIPMILSTLPEIE
jgi:hypothetical protein